MIRITQHLMRSIQTMICTGALLALSSVTLAEKWPNADAQAQGMAY